MANNVDPDQTAPIGAVCSGSTLFASIPNLSVIFFDSRRLQQTTFSDASFLGALRVKVCCLITCMLLNYHLGARSCPENAAILAFLVCFVALRPSKQLWSYRYDQFT